MGIVTAGCDICSFVVVVFVVLQKRQVKRKKRESSLSSCNKFSQLARIEMYNRAKGELRRNQFCPLPDDAVEKRLRLFRVSAMSSTLSFLSTSTQALFSSQCTKNLQVEITNAIKFKSVEFCLPIF